MTLPMHGVRQSRQAAVGGVVIGLACILMVWPCSVRAKELAAVTGTEPEAVLVELLNAMRTAAPTPPRMRFSQDVDVRWLLARWRFSTTVERSGDAIRVEAHGAPELVPPELLADLADFEKALTGFRLEYGGRDSAGYHLIKGVRSPELHSGASVGLLWVHPSTFLVMRTELIYSWGTVKVEQTFTSVQGISVLARQEATVSPLAARLTVTYRDYWFGR